MGGGGHPIHRVASFERIGTCALRLRFDDGFTRAIDFEPILACVLFGPLRDPELYYARFIMLLACWGIVGNSK